MIKLGVNIDHVATLRQVRKIVDYPYPEAAALLAQKSGADSIVAHLRKDRRHINEKDLFRVREAVDIPINLEMSIEKEIVSFACGFIPDKVTIVPERRQEITTEGGLDVVGKRKQISSVIRKLIKKGIPVSLFIAPQKNHIKIARDLGVFSVELHTGRYANAKSKNIFNKELRIIRESAYYASSLGLFVAAGHGLNYQNVKSVSRIKEIEELNIGHSIIAQSVLVGVKQAVKTMLKIIN